jgi:hypothetical protein
MYVSYGVLNYEGMMSASYKVLSGFDISIDKFFVKIKECHYFNWTSKLLLEIW